MAEEDLEAPEGDQPGASERRAGPGRAERETLVSTRTIYGEDHKAKGSYRTATSPRESVKPRGGSNLPRIPNKTRVRLGPASGRFVGLLLAPAAPLSVRDGFVRWWPPLCTR